jgi:undecaprenyl-diphosphatase
VSWLGWLDAQLFVLINQKWVHPFLDWLMPLVTDFDHWRVPLVLLLLVILARGRAETRLGVLFAILAVVLADQISSAGLKPLFHRERPFHAIEQTRLLVDAYGWSLPSSHAANTFAAGVFLLLRFRRLAPILLVSFLVSYSRVYVGVHYPSDVLAGAAVGVGVGFGCAAVERATRVRLEGWIAGIGGGTRERLEQWRSARRKGKGEPRSEGDSGSSRDQRSGTGTDA